MDENKLKLLFDKSNAAQEMFGELKALEERLQAQDDEMEELIAELLRTKVIELNVTYTFGDAGVTVYHHPMWGGYKCYRTKIAKGE